MKHLFSCFYFFFFVKHEREAFVFSPEASVGSLSPIPNLVIPQKNMAPALLAQLPAQCGPHRRSRLPSPPTPCTPGLLIHSSLGGLVLCGLENLCSQRSLEPVPLASPRTLQGTQERQQMHFCLNHALFCVTLTEIVPWLIIGRAEIKTQIDLCSFFSNVPPGSPSWQRSSKEDELKVPYSILGTCTGANTFAFPRHALAPRLRTRSDLCLGWLNRCARIKRCGYLLPRQHNGGGNQHIFLLWNCYWS